MIPSVALTAESAESLPNAFGFWESIEERGGAYSNVTYTHPAEDGSVVQEADAATAVAAVPKVGRNEPCPCGSGKKYKHCHGRLA